MLDGVFDQGLQEQRRDQTVFHAGLEIDLDVQAVIAEACGFDLEIRAGVIHFGAQRGVAGVREQVAVEVRQVAHQLARAHGVDADGGAQDV